ncbi:hypothetical protein FH972_004440 [Carpinus fangiana]|uniref:Sieve element occlusion N-terminal domain-containing protein n=1 Tax=Carpinus fangiana TaxID=176857 RepID=A0A5N6QPJ1_9ROSI|nr:hypothetical protein FH972_004440 [Carpinus fangiana]
MGNGNSSNKLNVLTMSDEQILNLISATHGHVSSDENFDADSVFVVVKNVLKRATHIVDNVILMEGKAPGVEIAHKTTMSILGKLSSYSWNAKAVLTLAAFALDYEDFLALPHLHSSHQLDDQWRSQNIYLDVTQDLLLLAQKMISMRHLGIEGLDTSRNLEKLFVRDTMQPLIDGSTNEMVSIDVLKKKNLLLFISGLNIYTNDMSDLMSIYDGIREKEYQYEIVWIPIVEQWTNNLRKKFEILRSKMPWYIVQYISTVACIKFMKEKFNNKPIVVVMNPQGDVENKDAFFMIQQHRMRAFPFHPNQNRTLGMVVRPPGPYAIEEYTFFCGGKDDKWIDQFSKKVNVVSKDPLIEEKNIFIELSRVGKGWKTHDFDKKIQKLLRPFKNESKWAVFVNNFSEIVSNDGTTIMNVLEAFEEWKVNVHERGFVICFKEYHDRLLQTDPLPSTSKNV